MVQIGCANIYIDRADVPSLPSPDVDSLKNGLRLLHMFQTLPESALFGTSLAMVRLLVARFLALAGMGRK